MSCSFIAFNFIPYQKGKCPFYPSEYCTYIPFPSKNFNCRKYMIYSILSQYLCPKKVLSFFLPKCCMLPPPTIYPTDFTQILNLRGITYVLHHYNFYAQGGEECPLFPLLMLFVCPFIHPTNLTESHIKIQFLQIFNQNFNLKMKDMPCIIALMP